MKLVVWRKDSIVQMTLPLVIGCLMGCAVAYPLFWFFYPVSLAWLLTAASTANTLGSAIRLLYVAFVVKGLVTLFWFFSVVPLSWLGFESLLLQFALVALYWIPAALTLASGAVFLAICFYYRHTLRIVPEYVLLGSGLVIADVLGSIVFSVYTLGTGSSVNAAFSFGYAGYIMALLPGMFTIAALGGVYALSFCVGCLTWFVYRYMSSPQRIGSCWAYCVIALVCFLLPYGNVFFETTHSVDKEGIEVAVVQTHFAPASTVGLRGVQRAGAVYDAVETALRSGAEVVILPEDTRFSQQFKTSHDLFDFVEATKTAAQVVLIDSGRVEIADQAVQRVSVYDTQAHSVYTFDKQYLVPQGEYMPWVYTKVLEQLSLLHNAAPIAKQANYVSGVDQRSVGMPTYVPNVLFCFESVDPVGVQRIATDHTPFVAHVVSHAWFQGVPTLLRSQLDSMLRIQSAWEGKDVVQSSNMTTVAHYTSRGGAVPLELYHQTNDWSVFKTYVSSESIQ